MAQTDAGGGLSKYRVFQTVFILTAPELRRFNHLVTETTSCNLWTICRLREQCPHPPGMYVGGHGGSIQELHGMQRRDVQPEKMDWYSRFSIVSGLLQPGIILGEEFAQEAQFPPSKN